MEVSRSFPDLPVALRGCLFVAGSGSIRNPGGSRTFASLRQGLTEDGLYLVEDGVGRLSRVGRRGREDVAMRAWSHDLERAELT